MYSYSNELSFVDGPPQNLMDKRGRKFNKVYTDVQAEIQMPPRNYRTDEFIICYEGLGSLLRNVSI